MPSLVQMTAWVTFLFILGLAATVFAQLLNGGINSTRLLYGKTGTGKMYFSPERVQLLLFTFWVALSYLLETMQIRRGGELPDIPVKTLALLSGSQTIYLAGKAYSMLFKKIPRGE